MTLDIIMIKHTSTLSFDIVGSSFYVFLFYFDLNHISKVVLLMYY